MPRAAPRFCNTPGCPNRVTRGHCPQHRDTQRPTAQARGYTSAWTRTARAYLAAHPHCATCGQVAELVDHITPRHRLVEAGIPNPDATWNLQPLCRKCHALKTSNERQAGTTIRH